MKILLAERYGFCHGVTRAIDMARAAAGRNEKVYTVGPLIHNPQMVQRLTDEGVQCVMSIVEAAEGTVVVRSHGEGPEFFAEIANRGLHTIDATCENVKRAQNAAKQMVDKGLRLVVVGDRQHPEVQAILAWSDPEGLSIQKPEQVLSLPIGEKLGIVVQTTFSIEILQTILAALDESGLDYELNNTVCQATRLRQEAARELASVVDAMIVVGGRNSANTQNLAEICREVNQRVYLLETAAEINPEWFRGNENVGVTAGASTPDWIIEEVVNKMQTMETMAAVDMDRLEKGSVLAGKVVKVTKDSVFVDVGQKAEGVISLSELAWPAPADANDVVTMGQLLSVLVLDPENEDGSILLSKVQADRLMAWDNLEDAMREGQPVSVNVTEAVKGGLSVAIYGIRGFIPASQVDVTFVSDLTPFAGQKLDVLPIEVDREKKRVVFSRRAILEVARREAEKVVMAKIKVGDIIAGKVRRLATFGVFVDIGGVDGLLHVSDMAWHRINDPSEMFQGGDEVTVSILKIDPEQRRISLGLKQLGQDPWVEAATKFAEGTSVPGKVTRTTKFGAFVELAPGVEGLVHISELADHRVSSADEVVKAGQMISVKVLKIEPATKRVSLSMVQAQQDAEREEFVGYLGEPTGLSMTIGDKLGHLFKNGK